MKRMETYLHGIKSMYFMLLACVTLSVGVTSCNQDEFENYEPGAKREFTKAELIEQALSRMPQTRSGNATVTMISLKDTVKFKCQVDEEMTIYWKDGVTASIMPGVNEPRYVFTDNYPSHVITISGSDEAIQRLEVDNNGLILLNVSYNSKLSTLHCANNHLDEIGLKGCPRLSELNISNNEFTDIDLTVLSLLGTLEADNNWLTELDLSTNPYLMQLSVENNKLKALDLSDKSMLLFLMAKNNSLKQLDLTSNTNLMYLDISSTWITNLSMQPGVSVILCENVPLETMNGQTINDSSFAAFSALTRLNIANTPFTGLDISQNPSLIELDISGTAITRLDMSSNSQIGYILASHSKLTHLIWGEGTNPLPDLFEVHVESTPFEKNENAILDLVKALPIRTTTSPGHFYTYSSHIKDISDTITLSKKNWLINQ